MQESKSSALHATNCTAYHLLLVECRVRNFNFFVVCAHPASLRSFQQVSDSWTCHSIKYPRFHPNLRDWRRSPAWTFRLIRWEISFQSPSLEWSRSRSLILISPVSIRPPTSSPPTSIFVSANFASITVTDLFCFVFWWLCRDWTECRRNQKKNLHFKQFHVSLWKKPTWHMFDVSQVWKRCPRSSASWYICNLCSWRCVRCEGNQTWKTTIDVFFCRAIRW